MNHISEINVILHLSREGDFHRFRDRHRCLTGRQCQGHRSGVSTECNALGHSSVRVSSNDDRPIIDRNVVENFVDHIGQRSIFPIRISSGDQAEVIHELHQPGDVLLGLLVPDRSRVAT